MRPSVFVTVSALIATALVSTEGRAQAKHPITFDDLMKVHRVDDPQVSPDGRSIAFTVANADVEANKMVSHLWLVPLAGGEPRQITWGAGSDSRPRWSPDGHEIAFISTRGGAPQVWLLPLEGGE